MYSKRILVEDGLISRELDVLSRPELRTTDEAAVQAAFDQAYAGRHDGFKRALLDARDYMGNCLAAAWKALSWDVSYAKAAAALLDADRQLARGAGREIMLESLLWRGIELPFRGGRSSYRERMARARARRW